MKKNVKIVSLVLVCILIVSAFGGTTAFAASPTFLSFYPTGSRTVTVNAKDYFQVLSSATEPPTVKADDAAKLKIEFDKQVGDATLKTYQYQYEGLKAGSVTVTVTSKDNLTTKETFIVKEPAVSSTSTTVVVKSDTTGDLKLKQGSSYTIKITGTGKNGVAVKPTFSVGNGSVLKWQFVKQVGTNFYYKITAIGKVGQESGFYTTVPGGKAAKQGKVIIVSAAVQTVTTASSVKCDTTGEIAITKGAKYCFKITVNKGNDLLFAMGTKNIFTSKLLKKSGNDYYYEITAVGNPGQSAGVYTTLKGQKPVKQCRVLIALG